MKVLPPPHPVVDGQPVLIGDRLVLKAGNQTMDYMIEKHGNVGTVVEVRLVQTDEHTSPESGRVFPSKNEVWIGLAGPFRSIIFHQNDFRGRA